MCLAAGKPGAQRGLQGQQAGSQKDQERHQIREKLFTGSQQQESAGQSAQQRGRDSQPEPFFLVLQVAGLGQGTAQETGAKGKGIGYIGYYGSKPDGQQGGEGNERSTAGQGVEHPGDNRGQAGEEITDYRHQDLLDFSIFAQVSFSVTVRLKTGFAGVESKSTQK